MSAGGVRVAYVPADPAGNLTALVCSPVAPQARAAIAARLMANVRATFAPGEAARPFEQVGFVDMESLYGVLPSLTMMGGEFCGNAARAFALYAARARGQHETAINVRISGAGAPVAVTLDDARGEAHAQMPLPLGVTQVCALGRTLDVVRMEGIDHAIVEGVAPSEEAASDVLAAMPAQDAQGVLFAQSGGMTPFVFVRATGTGVWESSCGSGSVALAWHRARLMGDGTHVMTLREPGGVLRVAVTMRGACAVRAVMGGAVRLGALCHAWV